MTIKIYASTSLASEIHAVLPEATCAGPVERGDLHRDLRAQVSVVGIVDGAFLRSLAISPTEIVDAMRVGIRVFGAGGIGALRAAELDGLGMIGCGRIYEHIRANPYFRDDYLGVLHEHPGSIPLIDFKATVERVIGDGKLTVELGQQLIRRFRDLHFSVRSHDQLLENVCRLRRSGPLQDACAIVRENHVSQRSLDALEMSMCIRDELQRVARCNEVLNG